MSTLAIGGTAMLPPSRAERNAAIAAAAAAQVAATRPWGAGDPVETASTTSSRQPSSRNTCPWASDEVQQPKPRRGHQEKRDTCPWGSIANDRDSAKLADAATKRNRESPKAYGAAGSGAPKMPSKCFPGDGLNSLNAPPAREEAAMMMGQKMENCLPMSAPFPNSAAMPVSAPFPNSYQEYPEMMAPPSGAGGPVDDDDEDEEAREQRDIINQCLAEGLDEERIMEILEEWANEKLIRQTESKMQPKPKMQPQQQRGMQPQQQMGMQPQQQMGMQPHPTYQMGMQPQQQRGPPASDEARGSSGGSGSSLAASRQARAKKHASFGPSDAEVIGVLNDYSKENQTPPESAPNSPGNALSLAAKRKKDRETSEASVGSFQQDASRAAYLESKRQMDAVKNKNRVSAGIF